MNLSGKSLWYLLLTLAAIFAGSIYTVTKLIEIRFTPLSLAFLRYFFAVIPMIPFFIVALKKNRTPVKFRDIGFLFLLGVLGISVFSSLFFIGVSRSTATNGSMLINTQPIFAVFLAPVFVNQKLTVKNVLASLAGIAGIILLVTGGNLTSISFGSGFLSGNLFLLGASLTLTLYTILMKRYITRFGSIIPTFLTMLFGTVVLAPVIRQLQGFIIDISSFQISDLLPLLYMGIFSTAYFFLVFNKGLHVLGVVRTTAFKFLIPVAGIAFSTLILKERPTVWIITGILIILGSIIILQLKKDDAA